METMRAVSLVFMLAGEEKDWLLDSDTEFRVFLLDRSLTQLLNRARTPLDVIYFEKRSNRVSSLFSILLFLLIQD